LAELWFFPINRALGKFGINKDLIQVRDMLSHKPSNSGEAF
jgi:hypothetical protein